MASKDRVRAHLHLPAQRPGIGTHHRIPPEVAGSGYGGKGMDKRTTGVRIMDANQNQGKRVNYMNKDGQTVDPSTGRIISNKDKRGHLPLKDF